MKIYHFKLHHVLPIAIIVGLLCWLSISALLDDTEREPPISITYKTLQVESDTTVVATWFYSDSTSHSATYLIDPKHQQEAFVALYYLLRYDEITFDQQLDYEKLRIHVKGRIK